MGNSDDTARNDEEWSPDDLSAEAGLRLAADPCRRSLLRALFASDDGELSVEDLVDRIEERTDGTPPDEIVTPLRHTHLPKLAASDVVEYDPETGTVALSESASDLHPLLEFVDADP